MKHVGVVVFTVLVSALASFSQGNRDDKPKASHDFSDSPGVVEGRGPDRPTSDRSDRPGERVDRDDRRPTQGVTAPKGPAYTERFEAESFQCPLCKTPEEAWAAVRDKILYAAGRVATVQITKAVARSMGLATGFGWYLDVVIRVVEPTSTAPARIDEATPMGPPAPPPAKKRPMGSDPDDRGGCNRCK